MSFVQITCFCYLTELHKKHRGAVGGKYVVVQVFGLDSLSGAIVWQYLLPGFKPFRRRSISSAVGTGDDYVQSVMPLFVQRTTAHFPHQPVCTVVGSNMVRNHPAHQFFVHFLYKCYKYG